MPPARAAEVYLHLDRFEHGVDGRGLNRWSRNFSNLSNPVRALGVANHGAPHVASGEECCVLRRIRPRAKTAIWERLCCLRNIHDDVDQSASSCEFDKHQGRQR